MKEESFLIRVVEMHYKQGLSQQEIANKLNISRTTVSRALSKAKDKGMVEIKINYPGGNRENLEERLEKKYGLKEVIIAYSKHEDQVDEEIAQQASAFLVRMMKNPMTIALTRGRSMQKMASQLAKNPRVKFLNTDQVVVLPTEGQTNIPLHFSKEKRMSYSNFIVEDIAKTLDAETYGMLCPLYVEKETKKLLLKEKSIQSIFDLLGKADLSMMGIGDLSKEATMVVAGCVEEQSYEKLSKAGGVAEFMGHIINIDGTITSQDYEDCLISFGLDSLKKVPIRAGIAYGSDKKEAVKATLNGGYINVLITDTTVAEYLLEDE